MFAKARLLAAGLACTFALAPAQALAADVVTNGTFDANINNWTQVQLAGAPGDCDFLWDTGSVAGMTGGYASTRAFGPSTCGFYQQIALAPATNNTLNLRLAVAGIGGIAGDEVAIEIRDTANVVLQTLYTRNGTQGADPAATRGPYNLNAYAGQTIRVFIRTSHATGTATVGVDNVVLDSTAAGPLPVPTLSEWAMILLGTLLAGGAALMLQRRRLTV